MYHFWLSRRSGLQKRPDPHMPWVFYVNQFEASGGAESFRSGVPGLRWGVF
jgi:hypothetical protein